MEKNTRNDLINCTFDEIYTKGYQGASLTNILKNAKVHKGSMYHFFENKKDMAMISIRSFY
nr:TetR/AcrR family transcriptional regulator [Aliarcobacter butzleri]